MENFPIERFPLPLYKPTNEATALPPMEEFKCQDPASPASFSKSADGLISATSRHEKCSPKPSKKSLKIRKASKQSRQSKIRMVTQINSLYRDQDDEQFANITFRYGEHSKTERKVVKIEELVEEAPELLCDYLLERMKLFHPW